MVGAFDYSGWTAAFIICRFGAPLAAALYLRESRGRRRPGHMLRYRWGIGNALFVTPWWAYVASFSISGPRPLGWASVPERPLNLAVSSRAGSRARLRS